MDLNNRGPAGAGAACALRMQHASAGVPSKGLAAGDVDGDMDRLAPQIRSLVDVGGVPVSLVVREYAAGQEIRLSRVNFRGHLERLEEDVSQHVDDAAWSR